MSGEKSVAPILIKKINQQEDDDGILAEALSNISDERATQFFISDFQVWKDSLEKGKQWEELDENKIYDESIARTKSLPIGVMPVAHDVVPFPPAYREPWTQAMPTATTPR